ncbi:DeoR/GlpR family DNA-binding transcription regulator [Thermodesulfobacteriota bacterium]
MIRDERKREMNEFVAEQKVCTIDDLASQFSVSRVTVHRILNELAEEGTVEKVHGGVRFAETSPMEKRYAIRLNSNREEKEQIARKALQFISDGDSIFIDSSTTCYYLAKELSKNKQFYISVTTNAPAVVSLLSNSQNIQLISTGGEYQFFWNEFAGNLVLDALGKLQMDKAFISAGGISTQRGVMTTQHFIAEIRSRLFDIVPEINLLVDNSKFTKVAPLTISPATSLKRIVADSGLNPKELRAYRALGIKIVN